MQPKQPVGGASAAKIDSVLETLRSKKALIIEHGLCYLPRSYRDECFIASKIAFMVQARRFEPVEPQPSRSLAEDQRRALEAICEGSRILILCGSPGTGKTTTIREIIRSFPNARVLLLAPTGKAARRVSEQTGMNAQTIHRALQPIFPNATSAAWEFRHNANNPFAEDLIIVDEISMCDQFVAARLLEAVAPEARLILIGDVNQLPSVGPGNVLRDLIAAGCVPFVELTTIKRQDAGLIVTNLARIREGIDIFAPMAITEPEQDFLFIPRETTDKIQSAILTLLDRLPEQYSVDPLTEIQIITPRRALVELSSEKLNPVLQAKLVHAPEPGHKYVVGDKVIQTKNDYQLGVTNGDIGRIVEIAGQNMFVKFENPERDVKVGLRYPNMELGYAITVHKFQGSEYPLVIIPIHQTFGGLVGQRSLLYTAISRAQRLCVLVGQRAEILRMIWRNKQMVRHTRLRQRLTGEDEDEDTDASELLA
jgi:exodeoxyribonuclease V alpha subunit